MSDHADDFGCCVSVYKANEDDFRILIKGPNERALEVRLNSEQLQTFYEDVGTYVPKATENKNTGSKKETLPKSA